MDIGDWLRSLGLERYERAFIDNAVDTDVLPELTESDLEKLGLALGDRKRLIRAVRTALPGPPAALAANGVEIFPQTRRPPIARAERRHLTVMICDLVGSTALSVRLDPEDMRAVVDAYHAACARITRAYDGFLAEFRGDGILAYFGYPLAHEDDAERTVRAGLEIFAAVAGLETPAREPLAVRIGIATGLVVVGDPSGGSALREHALVGETPNLAARLQCLAEPGTIVVGASTRRLLGHVFRLRDLGRHQFKGIAEPVAAWAVEGLAANDSRFEAVRSPYPTEFVGRQNELDFLLERQRLAWKGDGQIVLISGEPGIGKSRLIAALAERIASTPHTRLRYQCSAYHTSSALHPFIAQLERAAGFRSEDTLEQRLEKLETVLAMGVRTKAAAPLFASLLSIPFGERYPPLALSPKQQRRKTLTALLDHFEGLARREPILLVFEDAHWADATSVELLDLIVERIPQLPVIGLFTFRPEFQPPWAGLPEVAMLSLGGLDRNDVEAIVMRVTGGRLLPNEVMKQIVDKTDGNPLFIEELTKTVLETGILVEGTDGYRLEGPLPPLAIPATLQDSLMARLDRLASVREIGQVAAAIGREFSYRLLRDVIGRRDAWLTHALAKLEHAGLVFRRGKPPEATYSFKHALVRDAAYESILKSRRQQLHGQIARICEVKFPDMVVSQPEIVAQHFTEAGLAEAAISYWLKAGKLALSRSPTAAVLHLQQGLKLISGIDDPIVRNKAELLLQTSLGNSLRATTGWSTDGVRHAYMRALQLCRETGLDEHTFAAVFGLWTWNFLRPALSEAQSLAEFLLSTAERLDDSAYKVLAHEALGFTMFVQGKFEAAHAELERSLSGCDDSKLAAYLELSAQDPQVHVRSYDAMALWFLGFPDQALRLCAQARRYADVSRHPFSEAIASTINLRVHQLRGEWAAVAEQADGAIALCEEHEFVHYLAMALVLRGWARAHEGKFKQGIAEIKEGLKKERATGASLLDPYCLGLLGDACISNRRYWQAFEFLREAEVRLDEQNAECFYAAEIYRLMGKAFLQSDRKLDEAEHYFARGLKLAREQGAKSLELRLCLSMCELLPNSDECRSQLHESYRFFSEGLETADLVRARKMLSSFAS
ncbi:MAG: adenylate/guanylate cyclase [Microvirga sp.]|nr:adenylate/guanylate cyclase [Microvirga sp.]